MQKISEADTSANPNKKIYNIFLKLADELKSIINESDIEENDRVKTISNLDIIREELEKPKIDRDCNRVKDLTKELEKVEVIKTLMQDARELIENICYNR